MDTKTLVCRGVLLVGLLGAGVYFLSGPQKKTKKRRPAPINIPSPTTEKACTPVKNDRCTCKEVFVEDVKKEDEIVEKREEEPQADEKKTDKKKSLFKWMENYWHH